MSATGRAADQGHMGTAGRVASTMDRGAAGHSNNIKGDSGGRSCRVVTADEGYMGAARLAVERWWTRGHTGAAGRSH